jgi:exopolysaccharide production protein ExoQ
MEIHWWAAALTFLVLVANTKLGSLAAATFLGIWFLHAAAWPARALDSLARMWVPLVFPVLAVLSVLWSQAPSVSLRASIQLVLTAIVSILLARAVAPGRMLTAMLVAFSFFGALSLAFGGEVAVGVDGETASIGLFGSKNYQASFAAVLIICSLAILLGPGQMRVFRLLALPALLIGAMTLLRSRSAGATLAAIAGSMVVIAVLLLGRLTPLWRSTIVALGVLLAVIAAATLVSIGDEAWEAILGAFGKDSGLTGRAYLWYRAEEAIARDPVLGVGYQAYWVRDNPDAEGLWRYGHVKGRGGFHFHNLYVQTRVDLGLVGLAVLVGILAPTVLLVAAWALRVGDSASAFFAAFVTFTLMRSFAEVELTFQFELGTVLFAAVWVYATTARRLARPPLGRRLSPHQRAPEGFLTARKTPREADLGAGRTHGV